MPLTLDKLFSATVTTDFEWDGEVVHLVWSAARYTGEMDDLAEQLTADEEADNAKIEALRAEGTDAAKAKAERLVQKADRRERRQVRRLLSELLVSWDVMDGAEPFPTDLEHMNRLPYIFCATAFLALSRENSPDPQKAPTSDGSSSPVERSAPSPGGTNSSAPATTSGSPSTSSTNGHDPSVSIPVGATGG